MNEEINTVERERLIDNIADSVLKENDEAFSELAK